MALTIPFARVTLTDAQQNIPATAIPLGVTHARLEFDSSLHVDPTTKVTIAVDLSLDAGATWMPWGMAQRVGGPGKNKDGSPATMAAFDVDLTKMIGDPPHADPAFNPQSPNRRIRGQISTVGAVTVGPGALKLTP
jgi:hypothetical protein